MDVVEMSMSEVKKAVRKFEGVLKSIKSVGYVMWVISTYWPRETEKYTEHLN